MEEREKKIRQEDCSEDKMLAGILTLTNKRIAFDKTKGRIMDLSKKIGDTVIDIPLHDVIRVWKEGWLMKKVCFTARTKDGGEETYKFGVFNNGSWLDTINEVIEDYQNDSNNDDK